MDISAIINKVPAGIKKQAIKIGKHSPDILVVIGSAMVVGSAINACRQTLKATDILAQANDDLDKIEKATEVANAEDYTEKDAKNDRLKVYSKTAVGLTRVYGPSILVGATGLGLILGAHSILKNRNAALTVAYSNMLAAYNAYRKKVVEAIGEEKEFQLRSGYSKEAVSYLDENDEEKNLKSAKVIHDDGSTHSIYARIFDEASPQWSKDPATNLRTLRAQQNFANDKLRSDGILFLNDVYKALGFPRTPEGQIVGWVWDPSNSDIDSYVDFGVYDKLFRSSEKRDFLNGHEPCIWLDFNVDGIVYDLL